MKKNNFFALGVILITLSSCATLRIDDSDNPYANQGKKPTDAGYIYSDEEFFEKSKTWAAYSDINVCPLSVDLAETKNGKTILFGKINFAIDMEHCYCDFQLESTVKDEFSQRFPSNIYFQVYISRDEYWVLGKRYANEKYTDVTKDVSLASIEAEIDGYYDAYSELLHFQGLPNGKYSYVNTINDEHIRITTNDHIQATFNNYKYIEATGIVIDINKYGFYDHIEAKDWFGNIGTIINMSAKYDTVFSESKHE